MDRRQHHRGWHQWCHATWVHQQPLTHQQGGRGHGVEGGSCKLQSGLGDNSLQLAHCSQLSLQQLLLLVMLDKLMLLLQLSLLLLMLLYQLLLQLICGWWGWHRHQSRP